MASPQNLLIPLTLPELSSDEETCIYALQLAFLPLLPTVLKDAIELGVFEIIAQAGPGAYLSPAEISARLPTRHPNTPDRLDRMLRPLASHNILTCSVEADSGGKKLQRKYGASPVGKFFTKNEDCASLAPIALFTSSKTFQDVGHYTKDAIVEGGIAFDKAHGMSLYEFTCKDPVFNTVFNQAMISHSAITVKGILGSYGGFDDVNLLVDVGGGLGGTLELIVKRHPHIKGINFDLPHVIAKAPVISSVQHIAGDMFQSVPEGDATLMKCILHNWGEDQCVKVLNNCWKALGDNGKVIIMEHCLSTYPERTREAQYSSLADFNMMAAFSVGKERTKEEFESMAKEAGFSRIQVICNYATYYMLEFYK